MSACPGVEELTSYRAGRADASAHARIEVHLADCSQCRGVLEQIEMPTAVLRAAGSNRAAPFVEEASQAASGNDDLRFPGPVTSEAPLGQLLGYQIREKVGWGGGGLVYLARDARLDRDVALKFLRQDLVPAPRERARFDREARALASVRHPNIVEVHDVCYPDFFPPFLVLEYVGGDTLAQRLERDGPWQPTRAAALVRDIALALDVAHDKGLVHRDIKPANILFDHATDAPKLIDFGLARPVSEAGELTQSGLVLGTPAYMSPEQIVAPDRVDGRSDVYSLGVVLYEILTGQAPFRGVPRMVLAQIEHDEPMPPRRFNDAIPRDLETIVLKAMQKDPAKRYQSAGLLADDLERWLQGRPLIARPLGPVRRAGRWVVRHPGPSGLSVLLAGFLGLWLLGQRHSYNELKRAHAETERVQQFALEQRDLALDALLALVFEAQDRLEEEAEHDALRLALLQKAVDGLQKVSRTTHNAELVDLGAVTAHQRLGDVHLAMQQPAQALAEYEQARAQAQRVLDRQPDNPKAVRALFLALYRQGDVAAAESDWETATIRFEKARAYGEVISGKRSEQTWLHQGMALTHERLGSCALETGRPGEAATHFMTALREWQKAPPDTPAPAAWVKLRLAQACEQLGELERAEEWARRGRGEMQAWVGERRGDKEAAREWARAEQLWAELRLKRNDVASAREALEKIDEILLDALRIRPNAPSLRREQARVRAQLGRLLLRVDQSGPARAHLAASWRVWNELTKRASASAADWKDQASVAKTLFVLEAAAAEKTQARSWLDKAIAHLKQGRQRFGTHTIMQRWFDAYDQELDGLRRKFGV